MFRFQPTQHHVFFLVPLRQKQSHLKLALFRLSKEKEAYKTVKCSDPEQLSYVDDSVACCASVMVESFYRPH